MLKTRPLNSLQLVKTGLFLQTCPKLFYNNEDMAPFSNTCLGIAIFHFSIYLYYANVQIGTQVQRLQHGQATFLFCYIFT